MMVKQILGNKISVNECLRCNYNDIERIYLFVIYTSNHQTNIKVHSQLSSITLTRLSYSQLLLQSDYRSCCLAVAIHF